MHPTQQDFAGTYRGLSEQEIADLYADIGSLTGEARAALMAEIRQRGLKEAQLEKLHAVELRHEAQFDRLERYRRKKLAWGSFPDNLKGWIVTILGALVLILILELIHHRH